MDAKNAAPVSPSEIQTPICPLHCRQMEPAAGLYRLSWLSLGLGSQAVSRIPDTEVCHLGGLWSSRARLRCLTLNICFNPVIYYGD